MKELSDKQQSLLKAGIDQFNQREFFECHETLEELWQGYMEPDRELIQGIIQIAVAYYHLGRDNPVGALKLLNRGLTRVRKYAPVHFELDLVPFIAKVSKDVTTTEESAGSPSVELEIPRIEVISASDDC